jgi:hypothetical protein
MRVSVASFKFPMGVFTDFRERMLDHYLDLFSRQLHEGSVTFGVTPSDDPITVTPPTRSDELFLEEVFDWVVEITETYERLLDVELYVRRFPFQRTRINKFRYLRFSVEAYLHEAYMLSERLAGLRNYLVKAYRNDARAATIRTVKRQLSGLISERLGALLDARGKHVHRDRFSDLEIRQLGMMRIVAERKPELRANFEFVYQYTRKKKAAWVRQHNAAIAELLDDFFAIVSPIVLSARGELLPPMSPPG